MCVEAYRSLITQSVALIVAHSLAHTLIDTHTKGVAISIVGNKLGDPNSNPGRGCLR